MPLVLALVACIGAFIFQQYLIKKNIAIIQEQLKKMLSFLETASSEMTKFAKKDDMDILYKQARMFQGLETSGKN